MRGSRIFASILDELYPNIIYEGATSNETALLYYVVHFIIRPGEHENADFQGCC